MSDLRPDKTIVKVLISTASRLVGEYENNTMLLTHAWRDFHSPRPGINYDEGPLSRSAYMLTLEVEPWDPKKNISMPNYSWVGEVVCIYLSILFGKRFDSHGLIEGMGFYQVPDYSIFQVLTDPRLPQNNHSPRRDIDVPLNLVEVSRIEVLFENELDPRFEKFLQTAGRFYMQALQSFEDKPEAAYISLITAGEVLSNYFDYDKDELLDEQVKGLLQKICAASEDGPELVRQIKTRLFQVKKRFVRALADLLNDNFFCVDAVERDFIYLKKENLCKALGAAYDLRSQHVHTGTSFGVWISRLMGHEPAEVQLGIPVVDDKVFQKTLVAAPTFFGLERIIRYCLLAFMQMHGVPIDRRLANESIK